MRLGALISFMLLSWALHLYDLEGKSIWSDESLSIYRARKSIAFNLTNQIIVQGVVTKDTQPPLYFLLLHGVRAVAGESEFSLRFLSTLFSILLISPLYLMGKRLISAQAGLLTAFLAAISPTFLWYAQEIRMYTMLVFISSLSVYALIRTLSEGVGWRRSKYAWLAVYVLSSGAMIYTHYSGFFVLAFQGLVIAAFIVSSRRWRMLGLVAAFCLAALPVIPFILRRLSAGAERDFVFVPLQIIMYDLLNGFTVGASVDPNQMFWLDMAGLAVLLAGLCCKLENGIWKRSVLALFLVGYLFVPIAMLYTASYVKPMYMGVRHLLIIAPAFYLAVSKGLVFLAGRRTWPLAVAAGLVFLGGNVYATYNYFYDERYSKDDLRSLVYYVRDRFRPGDVLALSDAVIGSAFDYYAPDLPWTALPHFGHRADQQTIRETEKLVGQYERIWFVQDPPSTYYDPEGMVRGWLEEHLLRLDLRDFVGHGVAVGVSCFATRSPVYELGAFPGLARPQSPAIAPLYLLRYELPVSSTPSGDALAVKFYWWLGQSAESDYVVSLRLVGSDGVLWAQGDGAPFLFFPATKWPVERVILDAHELLLPPGTPPGRYQLELKVYRADTGEAVKLPAGDGALQDKRALGAVEIGFPVRPWVWRALPSHRRVDVAFGGAISLLAHTWTEREYRPGDILHLDLYWKAERMPSRDYDLALQTVSASGQVIQEARLPLSSSALLTSAWRAGDILRGQCDVRLPPSLAAGEYALRLQVYDRETGRAVSARSGWLPLSGEWWELARFSVRVLAVPTVARMTPPPMRHTTTAKLGEQGSVQLLGYDLAKESAAPGESATLTLYWQCNGALPISYSVFTHIADSSGNIWGQKDGVPVEGARPTNSWRVGEIIADTYQIPLKPETPPGDYLMLVGMYDLISMQRLAALDAAGQRLANDQIALGAIRVAR
jgi:hypothetical protein